MLDTLMDLVASNDGESLNKENERYGDEVLGFMTNPLDSDSLSRPTESAAGPGGWLKVGAVAAVSVFAGGLAVAWWYRNTLKKLHQAEETAPNPDSGISGDDFVE